MFGLGIMELLIIAAILLLLIGVPVIAVVIALVIVNRSNAPTHDKARSETANIE